MTAPPTLPIHVFDFDNSYARLGDAFSTRVAPTPVRAPDLLCWNDDLAEELGYEAGSLSPSERAAVFAGNAIADGSTPIAQLYAGHQFGHFTPQLGDGRALLLGEVIDHDGLRRDIQLKGSGPTPYSRNGDGRAALGPVLREYLVSEAMHAFGIPTTRALAVVATGEPVLRERMLPGAILTRVATSHLRVGSFEVFASRGQHDEVATLLDYAIARHDPELVGLEDRALRFLEAVAERQARLVAAWLGVGFVHGVMNTDNSSISGETIDFGPCAFLDYYDPHASFSSIDRHGRYAYRQQGRIAQWNLARLAQCLVPLVDKDAERAVERATEVVQAFARRFEAAYLRCMLSKLGILEVRDGDADLLQDLLDALQREKADFTQSFRRITEVAASSEGAELPAYLNEWQKRYRARIAASPSSVTDRVARMRATNPVYIPRNHLVEEALAAAEAGDLAPFERLREVLQRPFEAQTGAERYASAGTEDQREYRTFCGT